MHASLQPLTPNTIPSAGPMSAGDVALSIGVAGITSAAWFSANTAVVVPFEVTTPIKAVGMCVENNSAVSGNLDAGIYDLAGNLLASAGSTAQTPISTEQIVPFTAAVVLPPGVYFMAVVLDNGTGRISEYLFNGSTTPVARFFGIQNITSAFPLPNPATFAAPSSNLIPAIGVMIGTVA